MDMTSVLKERNTRRSSTGRHLSKHEKLNFQQQLPKGWSAAWDTESERFYYYHKRTRRTTFSAPTDGDDDADEGFLGRTLSKMARKKTLSKKDSSKDSKEPATKADGTQTCSVAFSALVDECKLCVSGDAVEPIHTALDLLSDRRHKGELTGQKAVAELKELVGATLAQQAALLVANAAKSELPHGWLVYTTDQDVPYYYNVHTRVTTWHKPTGTAPPPPPPPEASSCEAEADVVQLEVTVHTHNVAVSGFI